jgi:hypothetical protein
MGSIRSASDLRGHLEPAETNASCRRGRAQRRCPFVVLANNGPSRAGQRVFWPRMKVMTTDSST